MQLISPSWVKPLYKIPQLPWGPNWRHWIMYYQNWLYSDVFMGTSAACEWKGNSSQLQGSYLPLTRCKQYTANVKALMRWSYIALSLEVVAQKGKEILGTLLNYIVYISRSAQVHWSLLKTRRFRGCPACFPAVWTWLLQDLRWAATSNLLESFYVSDEGVKPQHPLLLQDVTHHGQKASPVKTVEFHERTQHLPSTATALASNVKVFLASHGEREGGTGGLRSYQCTCQPSAYLMSQIAGVKSSRSNQIKRVLLRSIFSWAFTRYISTQKNP